MLNINRSTNAQHNLRKKTQPTRPIMLLRTLAENSSNIALLRTKKPAGTAG